MERGAVKTEPWQIEIGIVSVTGAGTGNDVKGTNLGRENKFMISLKSIVA